MLFNELFENKKVAEGFADEFAAFAKERGGVLRHGPQARKPETAPAAPAAQTVDREALTAELKKLQAVFDPQYQYSADHSCWSKQHDIAQRIAYIKKQLSITERGMAEAMRNTDDPFDDMVEDYLDYLESISELRKSREEEKADLIADLEAGYVHPSEIEYALSGTKWDPFAQSKHK